MCSIMFCPEISEHNRRPCPVIWVPAGKVCTLFFLFLKKKFGMKSKFRSWRLAAMEVKIL